MSQIDNIKAGEPNFLDGSPPCPRQKLQGTKTDDELWEEIVQLHTDKYNKDPLSKYLTFSEYQEYTEHRIYKWDDTVTRIKKRERHDELLGKIDQQEVIRWYDEEIQKSRDSKRSKSKPNRYELGAREFTFTYSPKWEGYTDANARLLMTTAIQKLCKVYKNEIVQLRAVGEVGKENGLSHIHCFYKLKGGKKISDKNFKRAYPMWDTKIKVGPTGHRGGHHATVKTEADFLGYIDKEIQNTWFEVNIENSDNPVAVNS